MSVSWVPFDKPNAENNQDVLHYAEMQAKNFPLDSIDIELVEFVSEFGLPEIRKENYINASKFLENILNLNLDKTNLGNYKLNILLLCEIFPNEFKIEALKTLTNDEFTILVVKFKNYFKDILDGKHREYLAKLLIYYNQNRLRETYEYFEKKLSLTSSLNNEWTKKDKYLQNRQNILITGINKFEKIDFPKFTFNLLNDASENDMNFINHQVSESLLLNNQIANWNSVVPSKFKVSYSFICNFNDFLKRNIENNDFQDFFNWCDKVIQEKKGVYLWY